MTRKLLINFAPSLLLGLGIIVATLVAKLATGFGWWVMVGPALLALFVLCVDMFAARLRNGHWVPSLDALIMAGALPVAGFIEASSDPGSVMMLIPIFGAACCLPVVLRPGSERRVCGHF